MRDDLSVRQMDPHANQVRAFATGDAERPAMRTLPPTLVWAPEPTNRKRELALAIVAGALLAAAVFLVGLIVGGSL